MSNLALNQKVIDKTLEVMSQDFIDMPELDGLGSIVDDGTNVSSYAGLTRSTYGVPPTPLKSKWHVFFWLKWHFIVKPKLQKAIDVALNKTVDELLKSDILMKRVK